MSTLNLHSTVLGCKIASQVTKQIIFTILLKQCTSSVINHHYGPPALTRVLAARHNARGVPERTFPTSVSDEASWQTDFLGKTTELCSFKVPSRIPADPPRQGLKSRIFALFFYFFLLWFFNWNVDNFVSILERKIIHVGTTKSTFYDFWTLRFSNEFLVAFK